MSFFTTPILIVAFNRTKPLERLFEVLSEIKPKKLYVSLDGPRLDNAEDVRKIKCVHNLIESKIDWDCDLKKRYSKENLGCGPGPVAGINWFFENESEGIILEDDCIPSRSFFKYCEELLVKYRNEPKVMTISGSRFPVDSSIGEDSYDFSIFPHIWGWATWKNSWDKFSFEMKSFQSSETYLRLQSLPSSHRASYEWNKRFESVHYGKNRSIWDYQWLYASWVNCGLCIHPKVNMVENIGFDDDSTHTFDKDTSHALKAEEMNFPLVHPDNVSENQLVDIEIQKSIFTPKGKMNFLKYVLESIFPSFMIDILKSFR